MATNDYYHQQNNAPMVNGRYGITVMSSGFVGYTNTLIDIGMNLQSNADFQRLMHRLSLLEGEVFLLKNRLNYMEANPQLEEKFESLKRAGDEYRLIEKLVFGPTGERNGTS